MSIEKLLGYPILGGVALFNTIAAIGHKRPFLEYGFDSQVYLRDQSKDNTSLNPSSKAISLPNRLKVLTANLAGGRGRSFHYFHHFPPLVCDLDGYHRRINDVSSAGI